MYTRLMHACFHACLKRVYGSRLLFLSSILVTTKCMEAAYHFSSICFSNELTYLLGGRLSFLTILQGIIYLRITICLVTNVDLEIHFPCSLSLLPSGASFACFTWIHELTTNATWLISAEYSIGCYETFPRGMDVRAEGASPGVSYVQPLKLKRNLVRTDSHDSIPSVLTTSYELFERTLSDKVFKVCWSTELPNFQVARRTRVYWDFPLDCSPWVALKLWPWSTFMLWNNSRNNRSMRIWVSARWPISFLLDSPFSKSSCVHADMTTFGRFQLPLFLPVVSHLFCFLNCLFLPFMCEWKEGKETGGHNSPECPNLRKWIPWTWKPNQGILLSKE